MKIYLSREWVSEFLLKQLGIVFAIGSGFLFWTPPALAIGKTSGNIPATLSSVSSALCEMRVPFVENQGQFDDDSIRFVARTFCGSVYVTQTGELIYWLPKYAAANAESVAPAGGTPIRQLIGSSLLRERFVGALAMNPRAGRAAEGRVSYFKGDSSSWRSDLPMIEEVALGQVYPGIDLTFRAHGNNVEKIFTVAPGANPGRIQVELEGADGIEVAEDGSLRVLTSLGVVRFSAPVAYQETLAGREDIAVAYTISGSSFGFDLAEFDPDRTLVIDPLLASTYLGGVGEDVATAIDYYDAGQNSGVYVAGYTASLDFPVTNALGLTFKGGDYDIFITRLDQNLTTVQRSTFLGGSGDDFATSLIVLPYTPFNVVVAGYSYSTNYPTLANSYSRINSGGADAVLTSLPRELTSILYSTYFGGSGDDMGQALTSDGGYNVYMAGWTESINFPTMAPAYSQTLAGGKDAFVSRFDLRYPGGSSLFGSTYLGGISNDMAWAVMAETGTPYNVWVAGETWSTNFTALKSGFQTLLNLNPGIYDFSDGFALSMNPALSSVVAGTYIGGGKDDVAYGIDMLGTNVVVVGKTASINHPAATILNPFSGTMSGVTDAFVLRMSANASNCLAFTYLGGTGADEARAVSVHRQWGTTNIMVVGYSASADYPTTVNAYDRIFNGGIDGVITRLDIDLKSVQGSTFLGGVHDDRLLAATLANNSRYIFVAGSTDSENYPTFDNSYEVTYKGSNDVVVSRLAASLAAGQARWEMTFDPYPGTSVLTPAMNMDGNLVVATSRGGIYTVTPDGRSNEVVNFDMPAFFVDTSPVFDKHGNIYISGEDGETYRFSPDGSDVLVWDGPNAIHATPAVSSVDTNLYIGNMLDTFYSYAPAGIMNWFFRITPIGKEFTSSPVIGTNNTITVGASLGLVSLDRATGNGLWMNWTNTPFYGSSALDSDSSIYVGSSDGKLYGLQADGTIKSGWSVAKDIVAPCYSSPVIATNNAVYVTSANVLYSFARDDGFKNWTNAIGGNGRATPAIGSAGTIFAAGATNLYALTDTGFSTSTKWHYRVQGGGQASSVLLGLDGTVYFGCGNKLVAVFGLESTGETPWPTFQHDFLRSGDQGFSPVPSTPSGLNASKGDPRNGISVTWLPGLNASRYEVYRGTNDNPALATNRLLSLKGLGYSDRSVVPGKRYYYFVKSLNAYGQSALSLPDYGGTPPLAPDSIHATKGIPSNSIDVAWNTATYATMYEFYRAEVNNTNAAVRLSFQAGTNYNDSAINRGQTYYYWAKSTNEFGTSYFSPGDYGGTPPLSTDTTAGQGLDLDLITVAWTSSVGATSYELLRGTVPISTLATNIATLGVTNFMDSDVTPCLPYYYWVRATNQYGLSEYGAAGMGWRALYPPGPVTASDGGVFTTKVHVAWGAVPFATSYQLWRNDTPDINSATQLVYTYETAYDDTSVIRGGTYYYWARSVNDNGISTFTGPDGGGTPAIMPTGITAGKGAYANRIHVYWSPAYGATSYRVLRGTTIDPSFAIVMDTVIGTGYDDFDTQPGITYYYWVQSINQYGISSLSATDGGWISLSAPGGVDASDGTYTNKIRVEWTPASGAMTYELWRNTENNPATASRLIFTTDLSFEDTVVDAGRLYFYWVKAKTTTFTSGFSNSDSGYAAAGAADLAALDLVFLPPVIGLYEYPDAVSLRLINYGPQELIARNSRVSLDFYLSKNTTYGDADDVWFGRIFEEPRVGIGDYAIVNLTAANRALLDIPYVDTGAYYVFANVLPAYPSTLQDPNLANNSTRRMLSTKVQAFSPWFYRGINDFDGDGRADLVVYDEAKGKWYVSKIDGTVLAWGLEWGGPGYTPVIGDFNQDRKSDMGLYHEASGTWYVRSLDGAVIAWAINWGGPGFQPVWGDYDTDGNIDFAVFQRSTGNWFIRTLAGGVMAWEENWGGPGFEPIFGDYDGDSRQDLAVYQASEWNWYIKSLNGNILLWADPWGGRTGFIPVPGDYDGDGIDDLAVYHVDSGYWFVKTISDRVLIWGLYWGGPGLMPVPGDYDGDGLSDFALYNAPSGAWFIKKSNGAVLSWGKVWGGKDLAPVGAVQ